MSLGSKSSFGGRVTTHDAFEKACDKELESLGFRLVRMSYHSVLSPSEVKSLEQNRSATAAYLRSGSDCVAIGSEREFQVEYKSAPQPQGNVSIAAYPLAIHCLLAQLGVACLYVIEREGRPPGAFWATRAFIQKNTGRVSYPPSCPLGFDAGKKISKVFPGKKIVIEKVGGSTLPFVVLLRQTIDSLPDWESLIIPGGK